ncbi:hypothetical protein DNU06_06990 [Putridiphycobacter roseus]|uniref:Uncharacterized protein n=1 Tax=Putridiphycobacter roseus TaxID=2219161 RepID=A0A2W1NSC3_9FLAO|nr:hypothetical protein [Putridiphycobacter roseus]PZE17568.1 hypothetical protein DNU06_06990 [Putridiphycobacter roseus]
MSSYRTHISYSNSENSLYCDEIQLLKKNKEILAIVDYSSNAQLRKNTSRIKMDFEELLENLNNIVEVTCEGMDKKVTRFFKTLDAEPKKLKRACLIVVGEEEVKFECDFSLSKDEFTITKK